MRWRTARTIWYLLLALLLAGTTVFGQAQQGYQVNSTELTTSTSAPVQDTCVSNCIGVTQTGAPTGACSSYATLFSAAQFNSPSNWASSFSSTKISPGVTVVFCGIISSPLTFRGSGIQNRSVYLRG
jgi:hypothetical protein